MKKRVAAVAALAGVTIALCALIGSSAGAEHFDILLKVNSGDKQEQSSMDM